MSRLQKLGAFVGALTVLATGMAMEGPTRAAEYRTSNQGRMVVRTAAQSGDERPTVAPTPGPGKMGSAAVPPAAPTLTEEYDYDGDGWDGDVGCLEPCRPMSWSWGSIDYLLWWRQPRDLPVLVTTSVAGTPQANAGILGLPSTAVLFGGDSDSDPARPGGRLELGYWLDRSQCWGLGGRFFGLDRSTSTYAIDSDEAPVLARPFFNASINEQDALLVAFPGSLSGSIDLQLQSEVYGVDAYLRHLLFQEGGARVDLIGGYQFARINEDLLINNVSVSTATGGSIPLGTVITSFDQFTTSNTFHGGSLGMLARVDRGRLVLEVLGKLGLGNVEQEVTINGSTVTAVPNVAPTTANAGLLAQPSNIGVYSDSQFAVVPELGMNLICHLNDCLSVRLGYSGIFWNQIVQAADQIDTVVNPTQVPGPIVGPARPIFTPQSGDYWVHGLNLGVEWSF